MKTSAMPALSVVIPTLDEAESLPLLLERIYNSLYVAHIPFEIIIVDDNSTDSTAEIALNADKKYHVRLITKVGKPGKAYSLLQGFKVAKHDLICMIDADLQYPPEAISRMYHKLLYCNADVVITNRTSQQTSALRRLSTKVFHLIFTRALFGIDYDTQSGLKLFKKRVLRDISITPSPWTFDLEFIVRALENQHVILSEDITFGKRYAGEAKIHMLSATWEMAVQSLKLRRKVAAKQVKGHYRHLQPLQQSFNWVLLFAVGVLLTVGIVSSSASGLDHKKLTVKTPVATVALPTLPVAVTTPPVDSTPTTSTTDNNPSSTSTTSTTTSSASDTPTTTAKTSTQTTTTKLATTANNRSTSNPSTTSGQNKVYYPSSKLSSSKTNRWLSVALRILEIGVGLVALGLLLVSTRGLVRKMHGGREMRSPHTLGEQTR